LKFCAVSLLACPPFCSLALVWAVGGLVFASNYSHVTDGRAQGLILPDVFVQCYYSDAAIADGYFSVLAEVYMREEIPT